MSGISETKNRVIEQNVHLGLLRITADGGTERAELVIAGYCDDLTLQHHAKLLSWLTEQFRERLERLAEPQAADNETRPPTKCAAPFQGGKK